MQTNEKGRQGKRTILVKLPFTSNTGFFQSGEKNIKIWKAVRMITWGFRNDFVSIFTE